MSAVVKNAPGPIFLGLGAQPPSPEWGTMINDAKTVFLVAPHALLAPAFAVTAVVFAFNVAGEHLGQSLAPHRSLLVPGATASNAASRAGPA